MSDAGFAEAMYDEIYGLNCTIGQLTVENAKLREQLGGIVGRSFRTADKLACLEDENAKLRHLVRDYDNCTMHADCSRCEYDGKLSTHCPLSPCFPDIDELRELGVEVDA